MQVPGDARTTVDMGTRYQDPVHSLLGDRDVAAWGMMTEQRPNRAGPVLCALLALRGEFVGRGGEGGEKSEINPMNQTVPTHLSQASRCGARTRAGTPCHCPAIRGRKRCRLHGGLSPGAPRGDQNGNYTNGDWTAEAIEERRWLRSLVSGF